jgi:hypothetical protein
MTRLLLAASLLLLAAATHAQAVRVAVWHGREPRAFEAYTWAGGYALTDADGRVLDTLRGTWNIAREGATWRIGPHALDGGCLSPLIGESVLWIRRPGVAPEHHPGALCLSSPGGRPRVVLHTTVEDYLPGVLSAETGRGHALEFYRAQAIVARTYAAEAIARIPRHPGEGFDLCDGVHCQAYHGTATGSDTLRLGVSTTRGVVALDSVGFPITAAFHSNCGGMTRGSEDVWNKALPYLVARPDSFCLAAPHSRWEKTGRAEAWKGFLREAGVDGVDALSARQQAAARTAFGLRSARFQAEVRGNEVHFMGVGFGHGVGMCQEGAMARARSGADAPAILDAYFTGVRLEVWPAGGFPAGTGPGEADAGAGAPRPGGTP